MNTDYVTYNLREAIEELQKLVRGLSENTCEPEEFEIGLVHAYHHINTAWNARNATPEQTVACSEENFEKWRRFPEDLEIL